MNDGKIPAQEVVDLLDHSTSAHPRITLSGSAALQELTENLAGYLSFPWSLTSGDQAAQVLEDLVATMASLRDCVTAVGDWADSQAPTEGISALLVGLDGVGNVNAALAALRELPAVEQFDTQEKVLAGIAALLTGRGYQVKEETAQVCAGEDMERGSCIECFYITLRAPLGDGRTLELGYSEHNARWSLAMGPNDDDWTELEYLSDWEVHPGQVIAELDNVFGSEWPKPAAAS